MLANIVCNFVATLVVSFFGGGAETHNPSEHFLAPIAAANKAKAIPLIIPRINPTGVSAIFGIAYAMFAVSGVGIVGAFMANRYLPRRAKPSEQILPTSEKM